MAETILFVEDSMDDQFLFARTIRRLPFDVHVQFANDGDRALAYLKGAARLTEH